MIEDSSTTPAPRTSRLAAKAAAELARSLEHQRLANGIKRLPPEAQVSWVVVVSMARDLWDKGLERPYLDYVRYRAYLDAADAIARKLLGEA